MAAAHQLQQFGITDFIILEAQDYVGGRIKTYEEWGRPVELGAEFMHGDHTVTADIARLLNLDYVNAYEDIKLVNAEGKVLDQEAKNEYFELIDFTISQGKYDVSVYDIIEENRGKTDLTIKQLVHMGFADLEGDDTDKLDSGALKAAINYEKHNGTNVMLRDGYQEIVRYFSKDLPISLESPVNTIEYQNEDLTKITLADGEQITAKKVIITVSLGVLKSNSINFIPSLPTEKQKAIDKLGMGHTMKLFLQFKDPHEVTDLFHYADGSNGSLQTITNWWACATDPRVLVGYCGGARSAEVLSLSEDRLIEKVIEDLGKILGKKIDNDIVDYKISRWDNNPYTLGSYSYHPVHAKMKDRELLAHPIDDIIFWAGEATSANENYATVHGAISSGYRVAEEVRSSLA